MVKQGLSTRVRPKRRRIDGGSELGMSGNYEVELKFSLADAGDLRRRLQMLDAKEAGTIEQQDRYFNHPVRDFRQTDEALRLRQYGGERCITYKGPKIDQETKTRREIEIGFGDEDRSLEQFAEMLTLLGFRESGTVRKRRERFTLTYQGLAVEATIDNVHGLGEYVELEASATEANVESVRQTLLLLAEHLKLSGSERRSYVELLQQQRQES